MSENRYFESKSYQGVRTKKLSDGDIAYFVRFSKDGKQIQKKVGTKFGGWTEKLAFNKRIELEHNCHEQRPIKFKEVVDRFLELQELHLKKKSFCTLKSKIKHLQNIENKLIESITQKDINDLVVALKPSLSNKTINEIISTLKNIIKFAESEYDITIANRNLDKVKSLKVDNARERFLTKEDITLLKQELINHFEHLLFVNLALCAGARLMSVLDIRKKDIDLENKTIILRDFKNSSTYQGYLNEETKEILVKKWDKLKDDDKVIQKSKRLISEHLREILNRLFNQGITDTKQRVVIHTLRHTFASHLAIQGTPIQIIQKLLNHKDIQMTMRYSHLMPDSGREWIERVWG